MKSTKIIITTLFIFTAIISNAQLKVLSTGRVECKSQTVIKSNINTWTDLLDVVYGTPYIPSYFDAFWVYNDQPQPYNPGLLTAQSADGAYFSVRNNGRVGIYNSNPSCALEVGTVGTNYEIKLNGSLVIASDERVKENIKNLDKSLNKLKLLKSVSYNIKGISEARKDNNASNKSGDVEKPIFTPKNNKDSQGRNYYGFLAQDVQKLFPDLVYKDSAGMLGVDYIGIIPLLVNALSEQESLLTAQTEKIADLEKRLSKLENGSNPAPQKVGATSTSIETNTLTYPVLEQNVPNPFNAITTIGYFLPNTVNTAGIYVYDMNGTQLKSYTITEKSKGIISIQGLEFSAGMYLYALIADGKVIDTKRMILTK